MFSPSDNIEHNAPQSGDTLLLPSIAIGNVGQLAIDLLINTAMCNGERIQKIGVLKSRFVLPMIGIDPLDLHGEHNSLCTSAEVFRMDRSKLTILQIRSPIEEGCMQAFAQDLISWTKDAGFQKLVLLGKYLRNFTHLYSNDLI